MLNRLKQYLIQRALRILRRAIARLDEHLQ